MNDTKLNELLIKVKSKCPKRSLIFDDDTIKELIKKFYIEYDGCSKVDDIVVLLACNECQSEQDSDSYFKESKIIEASYWDIKTKYKNYDGIPYTFVKSQYGLEAYNLIMDCHESLISKASVRL